MLPIDRTSKSALDTNLVNGNTSDAPAIKNSNDVVYNTIDELFNYVAGVYNIDKFSQLGIINVKDSAFKASGSAATTTGSMTAGSATLTVASVIDFAVGQGINIAGAGASGATLITKINSISGTSLTLAVNAGTTVSNVTVQHDDGAAITAAINATINARGSVFLPDATYRIFGALPPIDVSKTNLIANKAILSFSGITSGIRAITLFSSASYTTTDLNLRKALDGITIVGGNQTVQSAGVGLFMGDNVNAQNSNFSINNSMVEGFATNLLFGNNAWRIQFINFNLRWGAISVPVGLTNFGENMSFTNCMFNDIVSGVAFSVGAGEWHFLHCSFDNFPFVTVGDSDVYFNNCHFENPASTTNVIRYIDIQNAESTVFLSDCQIIVGIPTGTFTQGLFKVLDANTKKGLIIRNLKLFQNGLFSPATVDPNFCLIAGNGRVIFNGMATAQNFNGYGIAASLNKLYNAGAETGDTTGWTTSGTGTLTADNVTFKNGAWSLHLAATAGQNLFVTQQFKVEPQQWLMGTLWWKFTKASGTGTLTIIVRAYSKTNVQISTFGYTQLTATAAWANANGMNGVFPAGTDYATMEINLTGGSAGCDGWIDDCIVNAI